jgi:hypothetical protein
MARRLLIAEAAAERGPGKKRKECLVMRDTFKDKAKRCFVVGGLLLLMSFTSVGAGRAVDLTDDEIYRLTYVREEEKLARDVYLYLLDMWGSRIFRNISMSEQRHMDAIKTLLDRYGIPDPVGLNTDPPGQDLEGVFFNPELQALYTKLIQDGSASLVEALKVGVLIEVTDIADLKEGIATAMRRDITKVYTNLLQGSLNHFDAFCSDLARLGFPYEEYCK